MCQGKFLDKSPKRSIAIVVWTYATLKEKHVHDPAAHETYACTVSSQCEKPSQSAPTVNIQDQQYSPTGSQRLGNCLKKIVHIVSPKMFVEVVVHACMYICRRNFFMVWKRYSYDCSLASSMVNTKIMLTMLDKKMQFVRHINLKQQYKTEWSVQNVGFQAQWKLSTR